MTNAQLVTVEELIEAAELSPDAYSSELLGQFIEEFEITGDNVRTLNIPLLLESYSPESKQDVSGIFKDGQPERHTDFTKDVVALAFFENSNTDIVCAYYDFENGLCYKTKQGYLFDDLTHTEPTEFADPEGLLSAMDELGVFAWSGSDGSQGIDDSQTMKLALMYSDGSVFKAEAKGILSKELPAAYAELTKLLVG